MHSKTHPYLSSSRTDSFGKSMGCRETCETDDDDSPVAAAHRCCCADCGLKCVMRRESKRRSAGMERVQVPVGRNDTRPISEARSSGPSRNSPKYCYKEVGGIPKLSFVSCSPPQPVLPRKPPRRSRFCPRLTSASAHDTLVAQHRVISLLQQQVSLSLPSAFLSPSP